MKEHMNLDDDFDFGFTLMNENELDVVQETNEQMSEWERKAQTMYQMIQPLLKNLASDESKEYIYWPDRVQKIQQFQIKLKSILEN
jgi:hypothetical protein